MKTKYLLVCDEDNEPRRYIEDGPHLAEIRIVEASPQGGDRKVKIGCAWMDIYGVIHVKLDAFPVNGTLSIEEDPREVSP